MNNTFKPNDSTRASQRRVLLKHLKQYGQFSTIESREKFGISHPAARVMELRRTGVQIDTQRILEADASGRLHAVALYVLKGGAA